jgi:hypothetical protein
VNRVLRALTLSFGVLLLATCKEQRTQLVVWVDASNALKAELEQVRIVLAEADVERETAFDIASGTPQKGEQSLPFSFGILAGENTSFNLIVRGYASRAADAQAVLQRVTRAKFSQHQVFELTIKLTESDRICAADSCTMSSTTTPPTAGKNSISSDASVDAAGPNCPGISAQQVCDPVMKCGCQDAASCQVSDDRASCASAGMSGQGETCSRNRECASGLSCFRGACRAACRDEKDCGAGAPTQCIRAALALFGFCAEPCTAAKGCASGLLCSPLNVGNAHSSFCLRVEEPCSSTLDGICDEAGHGTGFCAAGSDPDDCCTMPRSNDECDVVTQCGCPADKACRELSVSPADILSTGCGPIGTLPIGARCDNDAQCIKGTDCKGSICKATCDDTERGRCAVGVCHTFVNAPNPRDKAGVCWQPCDWKTQEPCMQGTVCAQLGVGANCFVQGEKCPDIFINNHVCDENSRACKPGTDSDADCDRDAGR